MEAVAYPHIELVDGVPMILGTGLKVIDLVLDQAAHDWDAHQLRRQYPFLTLAQIYSALAYYHDHHEALDAAIAERLRREERIVAELEQSPLQLKLRAIKRGQ